MSKIMSVLRLIAVSITPFKKNLDLIKPTISKLTTFHLECKKTTNKSVCATLLQRSRSNLNLSHSNDLKERKNALR